MKNFPEQIIQEGGFRNINRIDLHGDKIKIVPEQAKDNDAGWVMDAAEESDFEETITVAYRKDNNPNYIINRLAGKEEENKLSLIVVYRNGRFSEISTSQTYTVWWEDVPDNSLLRPETTEANR